MKRIPIYLLLLFLFSVSCKKNEIEKTEVSSSVRGNNTVIPYVFDWETADYMPTPSNRSILVPWASNANRAFPLLYATDIKKADGWELVYSTFSPTKVDEPAFFALYNKYRGVLRGYAYLAPTSPIPSSYVSHSLIQNTAGTDAKVLTYSGSQFTNLDTNNNVVSLTQPYRTSATGTWYAQEFEMAYDPEVGTKPAISNVMTWTINSVNVTSVSLNGTSQGSIRGTIATPRSAQNLFGTILNAGLQFAGKGILDELIRDKVLPGIFNDKLQTSIKNGLQGSAKNVVNGVFSRIMNGNSAPDSSRQYVNLTTSANYLLQGSLTSNYQIGDPTMIIPGSAGQDNVAGYTPLYKSPLGIMSLSESPKAERRSIIYLNNNPDDMVNGELDSEIIFKNLNSIVVRFNPSVINNTPQGAKIENLKKEVISFEDFYNKENNNVNSFKTNLSDLEYDGGKPFYNNALFVDNLGRNRINFKYNRSTEFWNWVDQDGFNRLSWTYIINTNSNFITGKPLPNQFFRVSFKVVPNNGSAAVTIVKTFKIMLSAHTNVFE